MPHARSSCCSSGGKTEESEEEEEDEGRVKCPSKAWARETPSCLDGFHQWVCVWDIGFEMIPTPVTQMKKVSPLPFPSTHPTPHTNAPKGRRREAQQKRPRPFPPPRRPSRALPPRPSLHRRGRVAAEAERPEHSVVRRAGGDVVGLVHHHQHVPWWMLMLLIGGGGGGPEPRAKVGPQALCAGGSPAQGLDGGDDDVRLFVRVCVCGGGRSREVGGNCSIEPSSLKNKQHTHTLT